MRRRWWWPFFVLLLLPGLAVGQELPSLNPQTQPILKGQPSPYDGFVLNDDASVKAIEEIRNARTYQGIIETLKAENAKKDEQIALLKDALDKTTKQLDIANQTAMSVRQAPDLATKALEHNDKLFDKNMRLIEAQQKELDSMRSERKWMLFGGIAAALAGFLVGVAH